MRFLQIALTALFITLNVNLSGCQKQEVKPNPKWHEGQFVRSALTGQRGQVLGVYCPDVSGLCQYTVRFAREAIKTDTHLFTSDGPLFLESTTTATVHEFELTNDTQ